MDIYPKNAVELMDMFPTEELCLEYLSMLRWPDGYECIRCNEKNALKKGNGLYRCRSCKYEGSVIADTLFQDTHNPLRLWFQAIWYIVSQKNGVSALGLQKALGLGSYHTAWEWLHKLRRAMVRPGRDKSATSGKAGGLNRNRPRRFNTEFKTILVGLYEYLPFPDFVYIP